MDSAQGSSTGFDTTHRPNFSVEEVPNPPVTTEPVPEPLIPTVVETPPAPEPAVVEIVPQTLISKSNNFSVREHPLRALLFLIPAVLLVATIYFVARVTGNNYTMREPEPAVTLAPVESPAPPSPTPSPSPVKTYKNEDLLIQMSIPDTYEVLKEDKKTISLGRLDREIVLVSVDSDTDYDAEEGEKITVGGKEAVRLDNLIYVTEEPNYQFSLFAEDEQEDEEIEKIIASIIFLVDTSGWQTFENTTFNYNIKYPPEWTLNALTNKDGVHTEKSEISKDPANKTVNNLVLQTSSNVANAALTASEIVSSTRTLSGWSDPPKIELKKLGGGDAQVIQGELTGKWRAYVVIWYKNTVIQMTWDDDVGKGEQQVFDNMLASFEFTN